MLQSITDYVRKAFRDAALAGVNDALEALIPNDVEPLDVEAKLRGRVLSLKAASTDTLDDIELPATKRKR